MHKVACPGRYVGKQGRVEVGPIGAARSRGLPKAHEVMRGMQLEVGHAKRGAGATYKRIVAKGVASRAHHKEIERATALQGTHGALPQQVALAPQGLHAVEHGFELRRRPREVHGSHQGERICRLQALDQARKAWAAPGPLTRIEHAGAGALARTATHATQHLVIGQVEQLGLRTRRRQDAFELGGKAGACTVATRAAHKHGNAGPARALAAHRPLPYPRAPASGAGRSKMRRASS